LRSRLLPRAFALVTLAVGVTACSSEATRFENLFSSRSSQTEVTGSVPQQQGVPVGHVQTAQLPPPGQSATAPAAGAGVSGGGRGLASYQPGHAPDPVVTGSVQGQQPSYRPPSAPPASRPVASPARPAPVAKQKAAAQPSVHVVAPGDTLTRIARTYGTTISELARINNIAPHAKLNIGDQIKVPGRAARAQRADGAKAAQTLNPPTKSRPTAKAQPKTSAQVARNEPTESINVATPAAEPARATSSVAAANANPTFRWPAKGRVIAGFGPRTNGQQNDGINLALPEGTPVRAAEDGVVAYAGNELKGYGNLILVRHANGYVTAYAHAKELLVRRGDPIKRGQVIARSGQTGNVDAPQLHFEIRKGPTPLDPMPLLAGG
jgi:murein DD-endopeptidase MepM/ murein hydrolase activator NlpD